MSAPLLTIASGLLLSSLSGSHGPCERDRLRSDFSADPRVHSTAVGWLSSNRSCTCPVHHASSQWGAWGRILVQWHKAQEVVEDCFAACAV